MILFFFGAVALLVLAIALGLQAGRLRNRRVRRLFWGSLVSGLFVSALFLGWTGTWWLAVGPLIPLLLILLLRIRFPALFDQDAFPGREPGTEKEEDRKPQGI
jgi:hypothetical protein